MSVHAGNWEHTLVHWATEPLRTHTRSSQISAPSRLLDEAYQYCDDVTRYHSRTFYLASALLPSEKRRAVRALYAVCRITDDIVDRSEHNEATTQATLEDWYQRLTNQKSDMNHPVINAWSDTKARFGIPDVYIRQLVDGVALDIRKQRYETLESLATYAYGVASTVGLMSMLIIGYNHQDAIPYAVKLGVALQLTNILRDVGEDWRNGRIYLPQQELAAYGLSLKDLESGKLSDSWRSFMKFQIQRNRQLYAEALPGIRYLEADGRFAIAAAAELYQGILADIEQHDYDVFTRRARLNSMKKVLRLPTIWFRSTRTIYR